MCKIRKAISVVVLTKENGSFSFFSERSIIYIKEEKDAILMSDREDFMNMWYCSFTDLNEYWVRNLNGKITVQFFKDEKEQEKVKQNGVYELRKILQRTRQVSM